jgi:hypothetical protein
MGDPDPDHPHQQILLEAVGEDAIAAHTADGDTLPYWEVTPKTDASDNHRHDKPTAPSF